jgi:uncharacterized protein
MRWTPGKRSDNLEDLRGATGGGSRFGGGGGARLGLGGILLLLILSLVFKRDFFSLVGDCAGIGAGAQVEAGPVQSSAEEEHTVDFVSFVLDSAQAFWARELPTLGARFQPATLTLFRDQIQSACGFAQAATGPFYCPGDQKVYLDLGFYDELSQRFGAPGEFARAYVLAHELGHHVQNLLGIEQQVRRAQQRRPDQENDLSVRMELQADCFAGVWGHATREEGILMPGEVEEGLRAAASVGDDRIQRMGGGSVNPETFTHGSSAQRVRWFTQGFKTGDPKTCDTFNASQL